MQCWVVIEVECRVIGIGGEEHKLLWGVTEGKQEWWTVVDGQDEWDEGGHYRIQGQVIWVIEWC